MKHQLGLTLLEVSIALSIGMAILLMATKSMGYLNRYNATHEVKSEVALLRLALEDYYFNNCAKDEFPQPTIDILKDNKYLPAQFNADNGFGSPYDVYISNTFLNYRSTTKEPPSYTIALSLHDGLSNDVYQQRLGATDTDQYDEFIRREMEWADDDNDESYDADPRREPFVELENDWPPVELSPGWQTRLERYHWTFRGQTVRSWGVSKIEYTRPASLRWTYPISIKRQYGDRSLGRFKRFYGDLKRFYRITDGYRGKELHELCSHL